LIKKVDEISKKIGDKIIIQKGNTQYEPKNCEYFDFTTRDKFENYVKNADIVITHAGVGSIITSLNYSKPTIVVPRRKKYNEHRNDHQMDITKELEKEGRILACYDVTNLEVKIKEAKRWKVIRGEKERTKIKKVLEDFIESVNE
jgi:UDP-N-acetylglucosamine transferase subunit ALG13